MPLQIPLYIYTLSIDYQDCQIRACRKHIFQVCHEIISTAKNMFQKDLCEFFIE